MKGYGNDRSPPVLEEIRAAPRFRDRQRNGRAACNGAPAACWFGSYRGSRDVQFDTLRRRQENRRLAVPRVRLHSACSAWSKGKVNDISRAPLLTPPGSGVVAAAEPAFNDTCGQDLRTSQRGRRHCRAMIKSPGRRIITYPQTKDLEYIWSTTGTTARRSSLQTFQPNGGRKWRYA
jgi:hypothetical protein